MKISFGDKLFDFYKKLTVSGKLPLEVEVMNPYKGDYKLTYVSRFLKKYYDDNNERIMILGINPGRFGGGETGINFTDGFALNKYCGIENNLSPKRELSSIFVYDFIQHFGSARKFYKYFFLSAVSPLGFTKEGKNYNYYDDKKFFEFIKDFIVSTLNEQINLGASRKVAVILGTGNNQKYFELLNNQYHFFEKYFVLEHPRYIMQYRRKSEDIYLEKYKEILLQSLKDK